MLTNKSRCCVWRGKVLVFCLVLLTHTEIVTHASIWTNVPIPKRQKARRALKHPCKEWRCMSCFTLGLPGWWSRGRQAPMGLQIICIVEPGGGCPREELRVLLPRTKAQQFGVRRELWNILLWFKNAPLRTDPALVLPGQLGFPRKWNLVMVGDCFYKCLDSC